MCVKDHSIFMHLNHQVVVYRTLHEFEILSITGVLSSSIGFSGFLAWGFWHLT